MKVLVATPVMRGELYLLSWLSWYKMDWPGRVDYFQMLGGDNDHAQPYNNIIGKYNDARAAALNGGYDALMTVESDTIVPQDALMRLAAADADVAYGLYVWRNGFPYWNAYIELDENHGIPISLYEDKKRDTWGKVIETKGVGNGCTLIKRHVLEALEFTWSSGEFGCCDWHLALDCQRLGFVQKHDMGVVCGHIAVNPAHRILWPDPEAMGGYTAELLENWPEPDVEAKQFTGRDVAEPEPEGDLRVVVKKRFHRGAGLYAEIGQELEMPAKTARVLLRRKVVTLAEDEEPGWQPKKREGCAGCKKRKRTEQ